MRFESNSLSERVQKPVLLAPVMGILLALWDCHNAATAAAATAAADVGLPSAVEAKQAAPYGDVLLEELASIADERFMSALRFMQDVDWCAAFPSVPLSGPLRAFGQLVDALAAARLAQESTTAGTALPDDIPDEFMDPITMEFMKQPVVLPDSQIVVDRSTVERHLLSSATDPFSRAPLTIDQDFDVLSRSRDGAAEQSQRRVVVFRSCNKRSQRPSQGRRACNPRAFKAPGKCSGCYRRVPFTGPTPPFPIKIVSVNKPLLQSMPSELLLLLPGDLAPLKAIRRPDIYAPPNVWAGELEVAPGPASGVVLTYAPDTDAVYGDIRFIDPVTHDTRSFWTELRLMPYKQ
eukprot:gene10984-11139_t